MKRATKVTALLLASAASAGGCAQVFGLGDYGPQTADAGEDASAAAIDSGHLADAATDAAMHGDSAADAGPRSDARAADANAGDAGLDGPVFSTDACSGSTACAPVPPAGWDGPLALWEGTGSPPPCATFYLPSFGGGTAPSAPAAQCTCSCGSPSGSTCGAAAVQFATGSCSSNCGSVALAPGPCATVQTLTSACGSTVGFTVAGSTATGGACQPDASATLPPTTWGAQAVACAPSSTSTLGCPAGQQCVPVAPAPFEAHFCIMKAGTNACPSPFTAQHLYYGGVDDTRACSTCTCGSPSGVDCNSNAHVTTWGNQSCSANMVANLTSLPITCQGASTVHSMQLTTSPDGGSCVPSGGQPTGTVTGQSLTTICCTQ